MVSFLPKKVLIAGISGVMLMCSVGLGHAQTSLIEGVRKYEAGDYAGAIAEWRPLAERGNRAALFNLGQIYRLGRGVEIDLELAMDYYEQAAAKGFTDAQQILATLMFYAEDASAQDRQTAVDWWRTAARLGNARAQYHLGVLHWNGEVVGQDLIRAYAWMVLAAGQDLEQAEEAEITMRRHLSVKEMAEGRLLANELLDREAIAEQERLAKAEGGTALMTRPRRPVADAAPAPEPGAAQPATAPPPPAEPAGDAPVTQSGDRSNDDPPDMATASAPEPAASAPELPSPERELAASDRTAARAEQAQQDWTKSWRLQLASMSSQEAVDRLWTGLSESAPDMLAGLEHRILSVDLGDRGIFYRLQIGPFPNSQAARRQCEGLQAAGQECFPVAPAS